MHVNGTVFHINVSAPDVIKQLLTAINPLWVGHKEVQQLELGRPHVQRLIVSHHAVGGRIRLSPCISITSSTAIGEMRRMTALMRATSSLGENGLVI